MTASDIQAKIDQMQALVDDPRTSGDTKKALEIGLKNAKEKLAALKAAEKEEEPAPPKPKPEKKEPKKAEAKAAAPKAKAEKVSKAKEEAQSAIDRCKELIAQFKAKKKSSKERVEKRRKAGKPVELTPSETVQKSAKALKAKVVDIKNKDEYLKKGEVNQLVTGILQTVKNALDGIEVKKDKVEFLTKLYAKIAEMEADVRKERADAGMLIENAGPGVKDQVLMWMNLNRDKLEKFTDTEFLVQLIEVINHFPHALGVMRWGGPLPKVEFTVSHQGKRVKVLAESVQEAKKLGAAKLGAKPEDVSAIMSVYDIHMDVWGEHPQFDFGGTMASGGRTKAAINRDRMFKSNEPWEKKYIRKSIPKNPRYSK